MALPGPSDRIYSIDNAAGTPTDWSALIVGEPGGVANIERTIQDLTGPSAIHPAKLPTGFESYPDLTVVFQADISGSPDPWAQFYTTRTGSRTVLITEVSGKTFSCEAYIKSSKPKTPVGMLTTLEVVFEFTGTATIV